MKLRLGPELLALPRVISPQVEVGDHLTVNGPEETFSGVVLEKHKDGSITVDWK